MGGWMLVFLVSRAKCEACGDQEVCQQFPPVPLNWCLLGFTRGALGLGISLGVIDAFVGHGYCVLSAAIAQAVLLTGTKPAAALLALVLSSSCFIRSLAHCGGTAVALCEGCMVSRQALCL